MVVPVLPHKVKACWDYFTFSRTQLPVPCVYVEVTIFRENDSECSERAHDLWFGFRLQFHQCRKEAAKSLPVLKPWQNSFMHLELSHWRCHGQISRSCVPNLSCNHFNQSCSSKGKITRTLFCLMRQNGLYLTLSRTFKQHACMLLKNLQFCWVKAESEMNIFMICGGGVYAEQNFLEEERTRSQKMRLHPSLSVRPAPNTEVKPRLCCSLRDQQGTMP